MQDPLEHDPDRLSVLARAARSARALAREATDRAADLRELRIQRQRAADLAKMNADAYSGLARVEADELATRARADVDAVAQRQRLAQSEADSAGAEAARRGSLFRACLAHAVASGLPVPDELADDAARLRNGTHPPSALGVQAN